MKVPLFRLFNGGSGDHFYTTSELEKGGALASGYTDEGISCFVFSDNISGTVALFRLFNGGSGDHFYTTSKLEKGGALASGYRDEGISCLVWTP